MRLGLFIETLPNALLRRPHTFFRLVNVSTHGKYLCFK